MEEQPFRIDRTHFEILSYEQADKEINDHSDMTWQERFTLHQYLNSIAYAYAGREAPGIDKTIFSCRKFSNGEHFLP